MTMTRAIEVWPEAKVGKVLSKSKQVLLRLLYTLQTQNRSPFPAKVVKITNNERFYIN